MSPLDLFRRWTLLHISIHPAGVGPSGLTSPVPAAAFRLRLHLFFERFAFQKMSWTDTLNEGSQAPLGWAPTPAGADQRIFPGEKILFKNPWAGSYRLGFF